MEETFELVTDRLLLAIPGARAAAAQARFYARNVEHLRPWEAAVEEKHCDPENQAKWLDQHVEDAAAGRSYRYLIFLRENGLSGEVVGHGNLHNVTRGILQAAVLGYSLSAEYQGRGIITEACEALVRYAFETLHLHRLTLNYQPRNERSARVAQRLGFEVEGTARSYLYIDGAWRDHILTAKINPKNVLPA